MTDLSEMRRVAEAATPGPWKHQHADDDSYGSPIDRVNPADSAAAIVFTENCFSPEQEFANAAHIATFDPPTVLALLDRIERQASEIERLREALEAIVKMERTSGYRSLAEAPVDFARIARAALNEKEPDAECDGSRDCKATTHIHGCFAEGT